MGIKKLTVENAEIKTASVEVKALTISGKQVTLAVFRQLPERSVIAWNRERPVGIPGKVWGRVNYHPDKCGDDKDDHIHVVWQYEEVLYRDYVCLDYLAVIARRERETYVLERNRYGDPIALHRKNQPHGTPPYEYSEESAEAYYDLIEMLNESDQLFIAI